MGAFGLVCSAKDQLTSTSVAIKKVSADRWRPHSGAQHVCLHNLPSLFIYDKQIMKPFSTPVLAKRTYRELKLLKHIRHENIISLSDIFISPLEGRQTSFLQLGTVGLRWDGGQTFILSPSCSARIYIDC